MTRHFTIFPLGDAATTIELGQDISEEQNRKAMAMQSYFSRHPFEGLKEVTVAYSSLTVYYDPFPVRRKYAGDGLAYEWVKQQLEKAWVETAHEDRGEQPIVRIPVCYDEVFGIDLPALSILKNISRDEIIERHSTACYRVYMIGFLPGFPYLATVDDRLEAPRKSKPVPVKAGSVGIAGRQTGIYPFDSPGGWQIIGRTPLKLFDRDRDLPVKLRTGDRVQFYPVGRDVFDGMTVE